LKILEDFGKRYQFPENMKFDYDGFSCELANEIVVKMVEKYDNFIADQIAMEARAEGISDITVLNKHAIMEVLNRASTRGKWLYYSTTMMECSVCKRHVARHRFAFCPHCGTEMEDCYNVEVTCL
jgi:hypothetical protein